MGRRQTSSIAADLKFLNQEEWLIADTEKKTLRNSISRKRFSHMKALCLFGADRRFWKARFLAKFMMKIFSGGCDYSAGKVFLIQASSHTMTVQPQKD